MADIEITVDSGTSKRLLTGGKYCDKNILVTAEGEESGTPGQAATITVGETITGEPGTNASVENTGTTSAAVLKFTIPRGADGSGVPEVASDNDGFVLTARSGQPAWEEPSCGILGGRIVFDDTIEIDSDTNMYIDSNFSGTIVQENVYIVTLNNQVYNSTAFYYQGAIALGNLSLAFGGEPDTGEDFAIAVSPPMFAVYTRSPGVYQLKVQGQVIKQLDDKFIQRPILPGSAAGAEVFNDADNVASGIYSHAEGFGTIASGMHSHVQGVWNIPDESDIYAHIVGSGSGDSERMNIHTLSWNGVVWYARDIYLGGTGQDDPNAWKANLPKYTSADEGKILKIVSGVPTWVSLQSEEDPASIVENSSRALS